MIPTARISQTHCAAIATSSAAMASNDVAASAITCHKNRAHIVIVMMVAVSSC